MAKHTIHAPATGELPMTISLTLRGALAAAVRREAEEFGLSHTEALRSILTSGVKSHGPQV